MQLPKALEDILNGPALYELLTPHYWDGTFSKPLKKIHKISICTTVMNRIEDLKLTLPQNILDNLRYSKVEFVVIDYNSKDGVSDWIQKELYDYVKDGILVVGRTEDPIGYSMAHSRNVAFKLATGDIVTNVDADNFTKEGFASYLNELANQVPEKCIFAKGKKMMRGRIGFYRNEFMEQLGGYDEGLTGYGHDDHDLVYRAWMLGFKMAWFGGRFYGATPDHRKHQTENFVEKDWKYTEKRNKLISFFNLAIGWYKANEGRYWGKAKILKNFEEVINL
jgi:hypothetical protein